MIEAVAETYQLLRELVPLFPRIISLKIEIKNLGLIYFDNY